MKTKIVILVLMISLSGVILALSGGCASTEIVTAKSGAELWGENCQRCHNSPSPADYSDMQWETIGIHMKLRANITDKEEKKIVEFLQSAN